MKSLLKFLTGPGRILIANAPEGEDALLLAEAAAGRVVLHVARDDARMARLAETLAFFAPRVEVITLPAWDCLPYDRVSPHRDIVARRIDALTRLMDLDVGPAGVVVATTVNAFMQRVPPRAAFAGRVLQAQAGAHLAPDRLTGFLAANGYVRAETVGEAGEYAVRGGLIDLYPAGAAQPLRLDFFGDELETIRCFDPLTQITTGTTEAFAVKPVSEVILDDASIARFRGAYRELFGVVRGEDPLYEAVSAGHLHPGMEHWLPLFYEDLEILLDYLPADAAVTLDYQAEAVREARLESIEDFYDARHSLQNAKDTGASPYKPLTPDRLYLGRAAWDRVLSGQPVGQISPFDMPEHLAVGPVEPGQPESGYLDQVVDAGGRRRLDFAAARVAPDGKLFEALAARIASEQAAGRRVLLAAYTAGSRDRLIRLLEEHDAGPVATAESWDQVQALPPGRVAAVVLGVEQGFGSARFTLISEQDVLGERLARPAARRRRPDNFLTEVSSLGEGDLVVHLDHGIGRYQSLETLDVGGARHDCLKVIYHGGDKLFVPVENIEVLSRFGSEDAGVELDRLGLGGWQARKSRVMKRIKDMADELIKVAAARELQPGEVMQPEAGIYQEFCARFPYPETEDQDRAIDQTIEDLGAGRPMDRLVCGDVGFGKTEVALRAAFVAVMTGRQVAIIVPTTLLARQHTQTFRERFAGLPVRIAQLSRLVGTRESAQVLAGLADGTLDLVVGTHRLLGKQVAFRDLGLLIVDEEQHFGVKQKERLKRLRQDVHVLTLTATPIPRTLQLALAGVKEMSLIATPPVDRLAVRTFVLPYDPVVVREAILRERHRGGQTFYVCPRIQDLEELEERLRKLVPEVKLAIAHGRLAPSHLEAVMTDFVDGKVNLLLSTNIIESGLDIPNANTLIVHRADMFGLSQLYQLRGRIGRSKLRGYAYLTLPPGRLLTAAADKRLQVMQTLDSLGAGFTLASHDLDIRGAGNLLGEEQSGHIREVGIELYQQLLEDAVATARGTVEEAGEAAWTPQINLGTSVLIPQAYVSDLNVRLGLYRRLSELVDRAEIDAFAAELIDRFGPLPDEVENLLQVIAIKRLCRDAGVGKIEAGPKGAVVSFHQDRVGDLDALLDFVQRQAGSVQLRPDHKLVYRRQWDDPRQRVAGVRRLLDDLGNVAA